MTTTTNNDLHQNLDEPLKKRPRLNQDNQNIEVCIDLKKLIYYNEISSKINHDSNELTNSTEIDGGDSGFQDFTSNDSPLNSNSQKSSCNSNESSNELQPSKFSSIEKYDENENISNLKKSLALNNSKNLDNCKISKSFNLDFSESLINQIEDHSNSGNLVDSSNLNNVDEDLVDLNDLNDDDNDLIDLNDDDNNSIISGISCLNYLSDFKKWYSNFEPLSWVQQQISFGTNPRQIINDISPDNLIPNQVDNFTLWRIIIDILSEPPKRKKLTQFNNLEDVVSLIKKSKKIIVLTGAGISVSSGIPDFRSKDGIYARLKSDFPDLPDPQAMFDINYFRKDQRPFFKFAKEIYPGQFKPSLSHNFIKLIEQHGKLLRNYTQNIDTLEKAINIEKIITCHGSFATASCTNCKYKVDGSVIKDDIFAQRIPLCPKCPNDNSKLSVMKPDIVFFGEGLPDEFHDSMTIDKNECDLLIVIGSSLKVRPVALIPNSLPADVPQILINREHLSHMTFDVELLGDCDVIIDELCQRLGDGWNNICKNNRLKELKDFNFEEVFSKLSNENKNNELSSLSDDQESASTSKTDFEDRFCFNNILPDDSYIFLPPNRYIFKGAEFYFDGYSSSESEDDEEEDEENDDQKQNDSDFSDNLNSLCYQESSNLLESSSENNSSDSETQPKNVSQSIINSNDSFNSLDN